MQFKSWLHQSCGTRLFLRAAIDPADRFAKAPKVSQHTELASVTAAVARMPRQFADLVRAESARITERYRAHRLYRGARHVRACLAWRDLSSRLIVILAPPAVAIGVLLANQPDLVHGDRSVFAGMLDKTPLFAESILVIIVYVLYRLVIRHVWVVGTYGAGRIFTVLPRFLAWAVIKISATYHAVFSRQDRDEYTSRPLRFSYRSSNSSEISQGNMLDRAPARIGEMLVARGLLSAGELGHALRVHRTRDVPLGRVLMRDGLVREEDLLDVMADQIGWPVKHFSPETVPLAVTRRLPFELIRRYRALPIAIRVDGQIMIATYKTLDATARRRIEIAADAPVMFFLSTRASVRTGIHMCGQIRALVDESTLARYEDHSIGWALEQLIGNDTDAWGGMRQVPGGA